jgi:biotin carboxyl carrier protein
MKRYRITIEDRTFDVEVLDDPRLEQVRVNVDGEAFTVGVETMTETAPAISAPAPEVLSEPGKESAASASPSFAPTDQIMNSPLPGVIKSIAVRPGQQIAPNDELLVIEAMKMDNVIRAPCQGVVGTIYVAEGRQVAHGEPLLDFAD